MEKELKEVRIYGIMEDDDLQAVLDKVNRKEDFSHEEIGDLLRQILHWRSQYNREKHNFKNAVKQRDFNKKKLDEKVERYERAINEAIGSINREAFRTACNGLENVLEGK